MRFNRVVAASALCLAASCRDVEPVTAPRASELGTDAKQVNTPTAIATAGCAVGHAMEDGASRVVFLSRSEVPFALPPMNTVPAMKNGRAGFYTKRIGIVVTGSKSPLLVACIAPIGSSYGNDVEAAARSISSAQWQLISQRVFAQGKLANVAITSALEAKLREATFPAVQRTSARDSILAYDQVLGTIHVTARATFGWWSFSSVMSFLSQYGEGWDGDVDVDYDEWSQLCDDYNEAYWDWFYSRDNAIAAAEAEIPLLQQQANDVLEAAMELEAPEYACKKVPGKRLCVDYFIAQCNVGPVHGDCRGFDSSATFAQSRLQIYINPDNGDWEMKFNKTKMTFSVCNWTCASTTVSFGDSTHIIPGANVQIVQKPSGDFDLNVNVKSAGCAWAGYLCPAINHTIFFTKNPNAVGGFDVGWAGNTSPSIGVYNDNDTAFNTMKEIPQKSRQAVGFIWGLINALSYEMHLSPPENPNNCQLQ